MRLPLTIWFIVLFLHSAVGQTFRTVNNPPNFLWSDPNSWDLGAVPTSGDTVLFTTGVSIVVNSNTSIDRIVFRGNSNLTINSGVTLTINERFQIQQISAGQTQTLTVNGTVVVGTRLLIRSTRDPNCTSNLLGSGRIVCNDRVVIQGDTSNYTVNLGLPIQSTGNFIVQLTRADGELLVNAQDSVIVGGNFVLNANNGSDSTNNLFNMQFNGSVLQIGTNLNLNNNGGYIQNNALTSSAVILGVFSRYKTDGRLQFHDLVFRTTSNANGDRVFGNVLGDVIIDNGCNLNINRRTLNFPTSGLIVNGSVLSQNSDDSLIFSGTTLQTISGTGNIETEYLVIDNSVGVNNSVTTTINRGLKIESGNFNTGNVVRLNSNSTRSAYLNEIGNNGVGASITGDLICERNITGTTTTDYRHFTSPVSGTTLLDIQDGVSPEGFWTYGYSGSNTENAGGISSCYTYDPLSGWQVATGTGETVSANNGWAIYCGGVTGTNGAGAKSSYDIEVSGTPNNGSITFNSVNSGISSSTVSGSNVGFIGNPYPSTIDWNAVTKSNVSTIAQVYASQDYNGYRATNFNAAAARIPPFQAFWVQTTGATPSVTFEENDKILNNIPFRKNALFEERFYFDLIRLANSDTVSAAIELNQYSREGFDPNADGLVFENPYPLPSLYSIVDDSLLAQVNSVPPNNQKLIPIVTKIHNGQNGWYSIRFTDFPKNDVCAYLIDNLAHDTIDIKDTNGYQFYATATDKQPRFSFVLNPVGNFNTIKNSSCFGANTGQIAIALNSNRYAPTVFKEQVKINLNFSDHQFFAPNLSKGNYQIVLEDKMGICGNDTQFVTVFEPNEIVADFDIVEANNQMQIALKNFSKGSDRFAWKIEDSTYSERDLNHTINSPGDLDIRLIAYGTSIDFCNDTLVKTHRVGFPSSAKTTIPLPSIQLRKISDIFYLDFSSVNETIEVSLFNLAGQKIESFEYDKNKSSTLISLEKYASEMILVQLNWRTASQTIKVPKSQ